jgi:hypothetical protein
MLAVVFLVSEYFPSITKAKMDIKIFANCKQDLLISKQAICPPEAQGKQTSKNVIYKTKSG